MELEGFIMEKHPCSECDEEYPLSELFCARAFRGANSICKSHSYSHLYCNKCLIKLEILDEEGHFPKDLSYPELIDRLDKNIKDKVIH